MTSRRLLVALNAVWIALSGCNMQFGAPTQTPDPATVAAMTLLAGQTLTAQTPLPSSTATPSPTLAQTATPTIPVVTVSQETNCRTGPGIVYDIQGDSFEVGESAQIIGKNTATKYWIINNPDGGGICWLWGQWAIVAGNTANLPEYPIPPTPTPQPTPTQSVPAAPQDLLAVKACNMHFGGFPPVLGFDPEVTLSWTDKAQNETGYHVYRDGSLIATLGVNANGYFDDDASVGAQTYGVEAFNDTGASVRKSADTEGCFGP